MPVSRLPSYRHHRPSGQAVVTLSGRDHYLGPWNSAPSRIEYERLVGEWLTNGRRSPETSRDEGLTIVELLAAYFRFAKGYYSEGGRPTSEFVSMRDAVKPLREVYSRTAITDFGPLALKAVRERMIQHGYCRTEINKRINRLRRVFRWGVENELVPASVLHALQAVAPLKRGRTVAPETEPVRPVADEHVDAILPHVSRQVRAMICLQRLCGMRPSEITCLRPCDIDQSNDVWIYRPVRHKTLYRGHHREIYLGPQAQQILAPWLDRDPQKHCFSPREAEAERNDLRRQRRQSRMTPSQRRRKPKTNPGRAKRERYDRDSYRRAIAYAAKKAGIPLWSPNQLRHSCATRVRSQFGIDAAQLILGHKSCAITEVYAEVDRRKALVVAKAII